MQALRGFLAKPTVTRLYEVAKLSKNLDKSNFHAAIADLTCSSPIFRLPRQATTSGNPTDNFRVVLESSALFPQRVFQSQPRALH
jgi:hypothetical protein